MLKPAFAALCLSVSAPFLARTLADTPLPYETELKPGSAPELHLYRKSSVALLTNEGARHVERGGFLFYAFPTNPGSTTRLRLTLGTDAAPTVLALAPGNKPLPVNVARLADGTLSLQWTAPATLKRGEEILIGLTAKTAAFEIKSLRYLRIEADNDKNGIPDSVQTLMREGLPADAKLVLPKRTELPATLLKTNAPPTPDYDWGNDGILATPPNIAAWHGRGATVWTTGDANALLAPPENKDNVQTDLQGNALEWHGKPALAPTPERFAVERKALASGVGGGADGVILPEPFYFARAGHEPVFKEAWKRIYGGEWVAPESGLEPRWRAGKLMSNLLTTYTAGLSQEVARLKPGVRRVLSVPNPLTSANAALVSPVYRLVSQPAIQDILSEANPGDMGEAGLRYLGSERQLPFSLAYLKASSLTQIVRGTGKRLTLTLPDAREAQTALSEEFATALDAALLFPDVRHFSVGVSSGAWSHFSAEGKTQFGSVLAMLSELSDGGRVTGDANPANGDEIGVLLSETAQWQREPPYPSDLDGVYGLALPLLQRGVPVQLASLDRADNAAYLNNFKTLILSYDFQKPLDERLQTGLANWTKRGGSLIFVGGSDPYNGIASAWWQVAGKNAPQDALLNALGVTVGTAVTQFAENKDAAKYLNLAQSETASVQTVTLDLTKSVGASGSVAVRLTPAAADNGFTLDEIEIVVGGKTAAAFLAGSDLENRFIRYESGTKTGDSGTGRTLTGNASLTYGFDRLPTNTPVQLRLRLKGGYRVDAQPVSPDETHILFGNLPGGGEIPKALPRLRIGANYPMTFYPNFPPPAPGKSPNPALSPNPQTDEKESEATVLYRLRSGGVPVWAQSVEKGTVIFAGVAPGYFSSSERSAALLRALVEYGQGRAGVKYSEPGSLTLQRGRFAIVKTFGEEIIVDGRSIDVFSPTLDVVADRTVRANSRGIYVLLEASKMPKIGLISGQVSAKIETNNATVYFVRGARESVGIARIDAADHKLTGARATNTYGDPVPIDAQVQGGTVLLKYPNDPDGVIIHLGWN